MIEGFSMFRSGIRRGKKRSDVQVWAKLGAVAWFSGALAINAAHSAAAVHWVRAPMSDRAELAATIHVSGDVMPANPGYPRRDCAIPENRNRKPRGRRRGGG